jgi:hypothetical protein
MPEERWIEVRDGQLILVVELDGWAYLHAKDRGAQTQWNTAITLDDLVRRWGEGSRLVHDARAKLAAWHAAQGEDE